MKTPDLDVIALGTALVELTPKQLGVSLVAADEYEALPSGATANFCIALAKLGLRVGLATRVGADELGQWLLQRLEALGVDTSLSRPVLGQMTPVSFCWMDRRGAKTFYFYRFPGFCDPLREFGRAPLNEADLCRARLFDFTEATIRAEPLRSFTFTVARQARALGLRIAYAVNYRPSQWQESQEVIIAVQREALSLADVAVMNEEEAQLVTRASELSAEALRALGPRVLAITAGARGVTIITAQEMTHVPALPVTVRYDIGAGDTFHAGFVAALLRGYTPLGAARLGSAAAALRISRAADMHSLPTWEEALAAARAAYGEAALS